jgi:electron transport complex protein RnfB
MKESRRTFLRRLTLLGTGAAVGAGTAFAARDDTVWQIDPHTCIQCGRCATHCVLAESAVKAVHVHKLCGHCDLCTAFFEPEPIDLTTGAENQLCPTGAILRRYIEEPYFSYEIEEPLCVGCGKCVMGCNMFGNGSMFLQIRHDRCSNCNACSIADACPSGAIRRVPASTPYLLKASH